MMERPRPQSKVSLEDLIRLKRAERPAPEFWAEFEEQLRHKQLAAIVDKRPWWRRLSTASFAKLSLPVGATAVIAFTLVSLRDRAQPAPESAGQMAAVSARSATPETAKETSVQSLEVSYGAHLASADQPREAAGEERQAVSSSSAAPTLHARSVEDGASAGIATRATHVPSLAQVILGLEGIQESDALPQYEADATPLLASMNAVGSGLSSSISIPIAAQPNPLTQVASSRDGRRARLLASVDAQDQGDLIAGNSRVARSRERIASRLTEQALYDSISRLGLNGDSVTIKF